MNPATVQTLKVTYKVKDEKTGQPIDRTFSLNVAGNGPAVRATFVKLLKERAWEQLEQQRLTMDAGRFVRLEAALFQDMAIGLYEWGDKVHDKIADSLSGFKLMFEARALVASHELPDGLIDAAIEQYGYDRLEKVMLLADGKPLPKGTSPDRAGENGSPTNGSPAKSSETSPAPTPQLSTV
jgi:hypothetical protein